MVVGTIAFGFAVHAIVAAISSTSVEGTGAVTGSSARALEHWVPIPVDPTTAGNYAFVVLVVLILVLTTLRPFWRNVLLVPTLYLSVFVWDARLAFEPSITRLILIGVILIVLMNARPQGLLGATRVEIV